MAQLECGKVQIYTGDGKGKTTAALGLSLRARGLGLDVLFLQFAKKLVCAEHEIAPQIGLEIAQATRETPELCAQQILNLAHWALAPAGDAPDASIPIAARNKPVDVLVLDEVGYAMHRKAHRVKTRHNRAGAYRTRIARPCRQSGPGNRNGSDKTLF